jgi:hypothetical protein
VSTGFTLIEAAIATAVIGIAFVAIMQLVAAGTMANVDGTNLTSGINLAKNIRELTLDKTYKQCIAMNGQTFSPPVDSRGVAMSDLNDWSQKIVVTPISPDRLTLSQVDPNPDAVRVSVTVRRHSAEICTLDWHRFRP